MTRSKTMRPLPAGTMTSAAAWATWKAPVRFTASTSSQVARVYLEHTLAVDDTGRRHQAVDPAIAFEHVPDELVDLPPVGHVANDERQALFSTRPAVRTTTVTGNHGGAECFSSKQMARPESRRPRSQGPTGRLYRHARDLRRGPPPSPIPTDPSG